MNHPGQRIQIDVKFVPSVCLVNEAKEKKFYQNTAIDEYSRWRFMEAFEEHSSYSSMLFLKHLVKAFPCLIECVQTDNGQEFTKRLSSNGGPDKPTIFQVRLQQLGIRHKLIRPFTPRHNGKVERNYRKNNERFYATHRFYSFEDFSHQLKLYNQRDYNHFPMQVVISFAVSTRFLYNIQRISSPISELQKPKMTLFQNSTYRSQKAK